MEYFGEIECNQCKRKAYYLQDNIVACGYHSNRKKREQLPKNPRRFEIQEELKQKRWQMIEEQKQKNGQKGILKCAKRGIFNIPSLDGFISVFPNDKARGDEFAMPALSPKRLGPVDHDQPGLPPSKTIENFHQFNKAFKQEIGVDGKILPEFYDRQREAYLDPVGHRHKFEKKDLPKGNINIAEFSVYKWPDGVEHRYSYLESRYFYCHWYEILAKQTIEFHKLKQLLADGYNLLIIGYDGKEITNLYDLYEDISSPFGHELVLCSLLLIENPEKYPWNVFHNRHRNIYP